MALRSAKPTGLDNLIDPTAPHPNTIPRRVAMKMEDNAFNDLPLLLAVPRAAQLLGISRAAAYRLAASGELPVRRLGGRVYVVTASLRDLAS
jgi:excisionase family DNA binding protein